MNSSIQTDDLFWQWPDSGPTPVNYGLDTEIFDSEKFPHVQTFVREAIQNSLDARDDKTKPVTVRFARKRDTLDLPRKFLGDLQQKKNSCGLSWPDEWSEEQISWLVVEDSNTSGLHGDLKDRTSDFWNYWLNFGISNKNGTGRGGRGIGRITFLIASGISTVIGVTRRTSDGKVAACGMSLLRPAIIEGEFKTSYAYLAKSTNKSIYDLYDDSSFFSDLVRAFGIADYTNTNANGLSLIIPFPHSSLKRDSIIAAAIEHFAPAIISGSLVIKSDDEIVDHSTIESQSARVLPNFSVGPLKDDPVRFIEYLRRSKGEADFNIDVGRVQNKLIEAFSGPELEHLRSNFESVAQQILSINVPLTRHGKTTFSCLNIVVARTPRDHKAIDLFFREGMCLPEVVARNAADVDLIVQSNEGELVSYLNFCEGKAHLGLIENKEVAAKLIENGFQDGYSVKRFIRRLMDELRALVLPDSSKPNASIFSEFFSVTRQDQNEKKSAPGSGDAGKKSKKPITPPDPPPPPPERVFFIDSLVDGFRIRANPHYQGWPIKLSAQVAYADGSHKPKWSIYDFNLNAMAIVQEGAMASSIRDNVITCEKCRSDFKLEVRGFDTRRELITTLRSVRDA